jgi:DMSO/TMAO reductase YedYZ molybdopterin-dependent catalytic subunit
MANQNMTRRRLLKGGGAAWAGLTVMHVAGPMRAFGQPGEVLVPWTDQPSPLPPGAPTGKLLNWETLESRLTPADNFFFVQHYGRPTLSEVTWRLDITGLVDRPRSLTLADLRARERKEVEFTLECSGNSSAPFFIGGIGNARWAGAALAPLLEEAGIRDNAIEVIFWGADSGQVTVRDNPGIIAAGDTGTVEPDNTGGLDLTITEQFARSMSVQEALQPDNLLCYEMNGQRLPVEHGYPVRLIAPGWFGVANVKWLTRIELVDQRYAGRFMGRDYVNIREQQRDGQTVWMFTTVGRDRLKSAPAKVTRSNDRYRIMGAAWGAPIRAVEVQIDDGPWLPATLDAPASDSGTDPGYAWRFWTFDWGRPASGDHRVRSRATDVNGNVQPAPNDAVITSRRTYWEANGQIARQVRIP